LGDVERAVRIGGLKLLVNYQLCSLETRELAGRTIKSAGAASPSAPALDPTPLMPGGDPAEVT
jgi:hypothetical protein